MLETSPMFYREALPSFDLADVVLSFWEFTVSSESSEPLAHEIFPDGCVSLFYHRNSRFQTAGLYVAGLTLEPNRVAIFDADVYWGMRISPAAACAVLGGAPSFALNTRAEHFAKLAKISAALIERLDSCGNFDAAREAFETHVRQLEIEKVDERVAAAVKLIEESQTQIKIAQIADAVGLSRRQFERRFQKASGLTPKQYLRARRIRATAVKLIEEEKINWAKRAAEMGFADQAHLAHEFSSLTKSSPGAFAERVKQIEHGSIVK